MDNSAEDTNKSIITMKVEVNAILLSEKRMRRRLPIRFVLNLTAKTKVVKSTDFSPL